MMPNDARRGFTLVELLVVISIIGVLVALLLPAVQSAREAARRTQCTNNLKQIGLAVYHFHDTHNKFPPARYKDDFPTWFAHILPYLESDAIHKLWNFNRGYYHRTNAEARRSEVPEYTCPSRRPFGVTTNADSDDAGGRHFAGHAGDYGGNAGNNDPWYESDEANGVIVSAQGLTRVVAGETIWDSKITFQTVTDGLSKTFLAGEKHTLPEGIFIDGAIYNGDDIEKSVRSAGHLAPLALSPTDPTTCFDARGKCRRVRCVCLNFGSWHPGITQFVMCDGSVHQLTTTTDLEVADRLAVRNDGEPVGLE